MKAIFKTKKILISLVTLVAFSLPLTLASCNNHTGNPKTKEEQEPPRFTNEFIWSQVLNYQKSSVIQLVSTIQVPLFNFSISTPNLDNLETSEFSIKEEHLINLDPNYNNGYEELWTYILTSKNKISEDLTINVLPWTVENKTIIQIPTIITKSLFKYSTPIWPTPYEGSYN